MDTSRLIATELEVAPQQVENTLALLKEGATVPFISRYRKDVTGNLDEVQIRTIEERYAYLTEFDARKTAILQSIESQDKLTPELKQRIEACTLKTELEDLYLPYRPKRRTRAMIAKERGLEPLADRLWQQQDREGSLDDLAAPYVNLEADVPSAEAALDGARDIIAERIAEDADIRAVVRSQSLELGFLNSRATKDWSEKRSKFEMYYDFSELAKSIPSHRFLAITRGVEEGILASTLEVPEQSILPSIASRIVKKPESIAAALVRDAISDAYHRLLAPSIETDIRSELKERADTEALKVFQANLRALLLAPPLGGRRVLALDPGYRTGTKVAVIDETGKLLAHDVVYLTSSADAKARAGRTLLGLIKEHRLEAIAIGNGTASREVDGFVRELISEYPELKIISVVVSEAGASVYSASKLARDEFPDLDVTIRGAISIGRRLQDPLAELVKIDPKAIGVGQYQHDVNQKRLRKSLDDVVESSVNFVGVEVNTASAALLKHVAGIGDTLANNIVAYRDEFGAFKDRRSIMKVPRFGPKAFEQAAGFLRIRQAENPLDNSAVHPDHYTTVQRMADDLGVSLQRLVGNSNLLNSVDPNKYLEKEVGNYTLRDILEELKKPGRDPREEFEAPAFHPDITEISHLNEGLVLDGVVSNVTDFGCFVDIGVHQDGLVHVSRLADHFVKNPNEVVKAGEKVRVVVLSVDSERKRISLSMRKSDLVGPDTGAKGEAQASRPQKKEPTARSPENTATNQPRNAKNQQPGTSRKPQNTPFNPAFADLAKLLKR